MILQTNKIYNVALAEKPLRGYSKLLNALELLKKLTNDAKPPVY